MLAFEISRILSSKEPAPFIFKNQWEKGKLNKEWKREEKKSARELFEVKKYNTKINVGGNDAVYVCSFADYVLI